MLTLPRGSPPLAHPSPLVRAPIWGASVSAGARQVNITFNAMPLFGALAQYRRRFPHSIPLLHLSSRAPKLGASVFPRYLTTSLSMQRLSSERRRNTIVVFQPRLIPIPRADRAPILGARMITQQAGNRGGVCLVGSWLWTRCVDGRPEVLPQHQREQRRPPEVMLPAEPVTAPLLHREIARHCF